MLIPLPPIGRGDRSGLVVEQAGEDQPAARRQRARQRRRQIDQRAGKDVGDEEVVGRAVLETGMVHAGGHGQLELAARPADHDAVDRRILRRDRDRDRVQVGGDRPRGGPEPHRGEGEQAGAGADVGEIGHARAGAP